MYIVYTNADSLRNKLDELKIRIQIATYRSRVICITEFKVKIQETVILNLLSITWKVIIYSIIMMIKIVTEEY